MQTSTLAIVLPVYNEGDSLAVRFYELQALRQRGAQVVVVDGGSTDATWGIAQRALGKLIDQLLLAPKGRASQMNAAAEVCSARTLLFLHADTQLPSDADRLISQAVEQGTLWGRFDVEIRGHHRMLRVIGQMMNLRSRLTAIATGDQGIFVNHDVFQKLGGYADLPLMEDIEISIRLKKLGPPACLREKVRTSGRRWEKNGVWRTVWLMWRLRAAYALGASPQELAVHYGYAKELSIQSAAIAIMAKAPIAGLSKTRLTPVLGPTGAARAQRQFALASIHTALTASVGAVTMWCAPDAQHRFFRAVRKAFGIRCQSQPGGDLGKRMTAAFDAHFSSQYSRPDGVQAKSPMLLVGTDCPVLSPGHLRNAARALSEHDVVLIPAEDGGYVLIGMRRYIPEVFIDIPWSTNQVMATTRERLASVGASCQELETLWDVDVPADWQRMMNLVN